jgi:indolepyruvate ferredoxin oxidoreductase
LADYQADIDFVLANWTENKAEAMTELLDLPEHIRGYGHVRERHAKDAQKRRDELRSAIQNQKDKAA